jgi:hypothetical protein
VFVSSLVISLLSTFHMITTLRCNDEGNTTGVHPPSRLQYHSTDLAQATTNIICTHSSPGIPNGAFAVAYKSQHTSSLHQIHPLHAFHGPPTRYLPDMLNATAHRPGNSPIRQYNTDESDTRCVNSGVEVAFVASVVPRHPARSRGEP